jgi:hypothetical protein
MKSRLSLHCSLFLAALIGPVSLTQAIPLPDNSSIATGSTAFQITNNGTGKAGQFDLTDPTNSSPALTATSPGTGYGLFSLMTGTGRAGYFQINNAGNSNYALGGVSNGSGYSVYGRMTGTGRAGYFEVANAGNSNAALSGTSNGTGYGLAGFMTGTGRAGYFQITNPANPKAAVEATTNGTGSALKGIATGGGLAGEFFGNVAVSGTATATTLISTGAGVQFPDGSLQQTAVHKQVIGFNLAAGASSPDIFLPRNTPIQLMGVTLTVGFRGVGQASLLSIDNSFVEWTGLNSTANGTVTSGYSGTTDTHIVQIDYSGDVWVVVGNSGGSGNGTRDTIRVNNTSTGQRIGLVTLIW